jgi:hypothetical protein
MLCPRCEQGEIVTAEISKTGDVLYVCEECEATWFTPSDIGNVPFVDFGTHMKELGLSQLSSELKILDNHLEGVVIKSSPIKPRSGSGPPQ